MERIKYYIEKYKLRISLIILILGLISSLIYTFIRPNKKEEIIEPLEIKEEIKKEEIIEEQVKVDIKGYVENPGVYEVNNGARVIDVINKAGGLKDNANTEYINLSKKIIDEMIIIIYSNDEVEKFKETDKEVIYIKYECICPDNLNDACITKDDTVNTNGVVKEEKNNNNETFDDLEDVSNDNLISINTGTLEDLMTLSGIGESKAKAIIEYRNQNGEFKKLEDIMNVSGIGEAAYTKIKDNIKL